MSDFDVIRFSSRNHSAEEKLAHLHSEFLHRLPIVRGYAELSRHAIEQAEGFQNSDQVKDWLSIVIDSMQSIQELMNALVLPQNREDRGLPELRPYECLLDAIRDTAQKLALPLAQAVDDPAKIIIHSQYPLVLLDEPKYHRELTLALSKAGYSVELLSYVEHRFQVEHQISLSTLNEVTIAINQWLVEQRPVNEMQRLYPISKNGC